MTFYKWALKVSWSGGAGCVFPWCLCASTSGRSPRQHTCHAHLIVIQDKRQCLRPASASLLCWSVCSKHVSNRLPLRLVLCLPFLVLLVLSGASQIHQSHYQQFAYRPVRRSCSRCFMFTDSHFITCLLSCLQLFFITGLIMLSSVHSSIQLTQPTSLPLERPPLHLPKPSLLWSPH